MSKIKKLNTFNPEIKLYTPECESLTNSFDSGVFAFNTFISDDALPHKNSGDGVTYLVLDNKSNNESNLVAYYTISASTIHFVDNYDYEDDAIPTEQKRTRYSPISSFMINMFAVNKNYQDCIYNDDLISNLILMNIISELYNMSTSLIGAKMIVLCSVKEAEHFYLKNNFNKLDSNFTLLDKYIDDTIPMYLPLHNINY